MLIARLLAGHDGLEEKLQSASAELAAQGNPVVMAGMLEFCGDVMQISFNEGDPATVRATLDRHFGPCDLLLSDQPIKVPHLFVSDMDSTMIDAECIDELADFAGLKPQIAAITERAMQGELDFETALRERVALLTDLPETAIAECLAQRIEPMRGARTLVATLKSRGCHCVLVTGGFHAFADPVAAELGFDRVVANGLGTAEGKLTGGLVGTITDSSVKAQVLGEEMARLGDAAVSLAMGDGANDIPMLQVATYGVAYRAKAKARDAADGWIERGDLTAMLELLDIPKGDWVLG